MFLLCEKGPAETQTQASRVEKLQRKQEAYQCHTQDLGKGVRGTAGWSESDSSVWCLKPSFLTGPYDVTEGQNGGPQAQCWPVNGYHNGLLKLDKGFHEVPGEREDHL